MADNFKHIIRIVNTDIDGKKSIYMALQKIRGIGFMYANAICKLTNIDKATKAGNLSDQQIAKLEQILKTPFQFEMPLWMVNRRHDYEEGQDRHIVTGDLKFVQENDKRRLQKIRSYRGARHAAGLPVRGQRTKSNFRKNKGKVQGVVRKATKSPSADEGKKKGKD